VFILVKFFCKPLPIQHRESATLFALATLGDSTPIGWFLFVSCLQMCPDEVIPVVPFVPVVSFVPVVPVLIRHLWQLKTVSSCIGV
jgi:hypothetical protein